MTPHEELSRMHAILASRMPLYASGNGGKRPTPGNPSKSGNAGSGPDDGKGADRVLERDPQAEHLRTERGKTAKQDGSHPKHSESDPSGTPH